MNRRGFFASLAAFVAVPFVPKSKPVQPARVWSNLEMQWRELPIASVGQTVTVRLPQRFTTSSNLSAYSQQFAADTFAVVTREP